MILFCEECGTRHDISEDLIKENNFRFSCTTCNEALMVSLANRQEGKTVQAALQRSDEPGPMPPPGKKLKVLVVDDSRLIRKVLRGIIESDGTKQVIGEAENGKKALEFLASERPDVITLDINMPVMDGLTTLKHIMINHPIPTVMISALTKEGATETFDSLKYGAIDFLPKPSQVKGADLNSQRNEILRKLDSVAGVQIESVRYLRRPANDKDSEDGARRPCDYLVVMGVAEGGYGALLNVIPRLNAQSSAAYIGVMRQAPHHIDGFVNYLDRCSQIRVDRGTSDQPMEGGHCYLVADMECFCVAGQGNQFVLKRDGHETGPGAGAIDRLMESAAAAMQACSVGVILTGTGEDGIAGLDSILKAGGAAFVQDPKSSLYKETPMRAAANREVTGVFSDKQMAGAINAFLLAHTENKEKQI